MGIGANFFWLAIDRRPSIIAQCASVNDVVRAIHVARNHGLEISVRGGGHGVSGKALTEGGLVIDLRQMHAARCRRSRGTNGDCRRGRHHESS